MFLFSNEPDKLLVFGMSMFLYSSIIWVCIMPIMFNFFIIPKIEKKVGEKLVFLLPVYDFCPFSKYFGRHVEIAIYIFLGLFGIKKGLNPNLALSKTKNINYDINCASKFEIVMSIIDVIVITSFCIGVAIMIIKVPPSYLSSRPENSVSVLPVPTLFMGKS